MKPLIVANWKMHLTAAGASELTRALLSRLRVGEDREVVIAPSFTLLSVVGPLIEGTPLQLGAQDVFWKDEGPFTGEISPRMLQDTGVRYVLVGHSERRQHMGETDRTIHRKIRAALRTGLRPILCVGEREAAHDSGRSSTVVRSQVTRALEEIQPDDAARLTVAYEPVWAIGTGKAATPEAAAGVHDVIRRELRRIFGDAGDGIRTIYGGSVTPHNIDDLMHHSEIHGVLVGGASLRPDEFERIVDFRVSG